MKPYSGGDIYTAMGVSGNDADMGVSMGWCSDYPDPYDWINILLYGPSIQADNNVNYSVLQQFQVERPDGQARPSSSDPSASRSTASSTSTS